MSMVRTCPITSLATSSRWCIQRPDSPRRTSAWPTLACAGRLGRDRQHGHRRRTRHGRIACRCSVASADYYATRHQGPVLQQLEHPVSADVSVNDCFRPVSRFFDCISRPEQLLTALPEAMRVLTGPGGNRRRHRFLAARRAGACLRISRKLFREACVGDRAKASGCRQELPRPQRF